MSEEFPFDITFRSDTEPEERVVFVIAYDGTWAFGDETIWFESAPVTASDDVVWEFDFVREEHASFPANALRDTRTVTMGEPSKVER